MSSNKASKQPKLTDKGRVSEELAPISDQPKPVVVDSFRRNAPTPHAPATREQTLSQMTLTQLGAQLPPKVLKEIYLAYKDRAVNILDTRIADCDKLIAINNSNDSAAVDDDRTRGRWLTIGNSRHLAAPLHYCTGEIVLTLWLGSHWEGVHALMREGCYAGMGARAYHRTHATVSNDPSDQDMGAR